MTEDQLRENIYEFIMNDNIFEQNLILSQIIDWFENKFRSEFDLAREALNIDFVFDISTYVGNYSSQLRALFFRMRDRVLEFKQREDKTDEEKEAYLQYNIDRILITETNRITNSVQIILANIYTGYINPNVIAFKRWNARINDEDTCKECLHLHGQVVLITQSFIKADGTELDTHFIVGCPDLPHSNPHPNCRCWITVFYVEV